MCHCSNLYNVYNNNILFVMLLCLQCLFFRSVWQRSSNRDCSLHIQRVFTQDWLIYYLSLPLSCPCSHFLENSIVTTLLFVYCVHIVVRVLCTQCCLCVRLLVYPLLPHTVVVIDLLVNKLAAFVCVLVDVALV